MTSVTRCRHYTVTFNYGFTGMSCSEESGSESSSEWEDEKETDESVCICLFCPVKLSSAEDVFTHCTDAHAIDIRSIHSKLGLDFYSCVKLINYIRAKCPLPGAVAAVLDSPPYPWDDDAYLKPVVDGDALLQYDFDGDEQNNGQASPSKQTRDLSVEEYKQALSQALSELASMREAVKELFKEDQAIPPKCVAAIEQEDGYFSTYTHFSIHEEMLKDEVRTEAYYRFITRNPSIFKDKVVLDVGCGTGILSMFAARAGAKKVIGVDQSNVIYKAMDIVMENGLDNKVTLVKGAMEEVQLPVEKVDVIISEWMGYCLLFESMLDTVIVARDRWLLDASQVYPNVCSISLVAMGSKTEYDSRVCFWDDVYGCKMTAMKEEVFHEAHVHCVQPHDVISTSDVVKRLNLATVKVSELGFKSPFTLTMLKDTMCHALVGYFDVSFDSMQYPVYFGTGPMDTPTHWKQTVFYLNKPIAVQTGDLLTGTIEFRKNKSDVRCLDIIVTMELSSFNAGAEHVKIEQKFFLN